MKIIIEHLKKSFNLTGALAESLSENDFKLKLKNLPSNSIGGQLWCIIGARESYLKAIVNNKWSGFSCSLIDTASKDKILMCLDKSSDECMDYINNNKLNENQSEILITLLEHEIQHHGQLIRYVYGNKLDFPESWKIRYTV